MRTIRRILAALLLPIAVIVAVVIGTAVAVLYTPRGRVLLARIATRWISDHVDGRVEIGAIGGNLWHHIDLRHVVVRDHAGATVLSASQLDASYLLPGVLAGRLVFGPISADSLRLHLVKRRSGRWNYEEVFHLGQGAPSGRPGPLVALNDLTVRDGGIQVDMPTTPGHPRMPVTRNGRTPEQPRIDTTADGPVRVYTFTDLGAAVRLLRISTPRHDPLLARVSDLHAEVNDPHLRITAMAGQIITAGDSLRFTFDSLGLPSTRFIGAGAVRWPHDTILYDFNGTAPRVALRDLRWIQPDFPDWEGRARVVAKSLSASRTDFALDDMVLGRGRTSATGRVTVVLDNARGLGMNRLDLALRAVPVDVLRPYLDTLPVSGTLDGHLTADGFLDGLHLGIQAAFTDSVVRGAPVSQLRADGVLHLGGPAGAVFSAFRLDQTTLALGTVHQLVPSVLIKGHLRLNGELGGPWHDAQFTGIAEHVAPDSATSRLVGKARLDTRGRVLGMAIDADLDPLSFDALRSGYPSLPTRGAVSGHLVANGNLDSLDIDADLAGDIGVVNAAGRITVDAPHFGADSLVVDLGRFDVQAALGHGTATALNGRVVVRGALDSGAPPRGMVRLALDRSRFGGATVDAVTGVVHADHGLLTVDTGSVLWSTGRVDARGTLGWAAPDSGTLRVTAMARSLAPFDSLLRAHVAVPVDTVAPHVFDGNARAEVQIAGAVNNATLSGRVDALHLIVDQWHASHLVAQFRADSFGARGFTVAVDGDTVGHTVHVADTVHVQAAGTVDSLHIAGGFAMVALDASGGGTWLRRPGASSAALDSLVLRFPHQTWRLAEPAHIGMSEGRIAVRDTLRIRNVNGSGDIRVTGTVPGDTPGAMHVSVVGLQLIDVFGVIERDTTALNGWGSLDLQLDGTREAPTFHGTAMVTGPVIGGAQLPAAEVRFDYVARQLHSQLSLWRAGDRVLTGEVTLPLDLALASRPSRKIPGTLQITGTADSVDLVLLEPIVSGIRDATGSMSFDLRGGGTWAAPRLEGAFTLRGGAMTLPSLNVRYTGIEGSARFVADSMVIDSLAVGGGTGVLHITGGLRFPELARPSMDLTLKADDFLAIDEPGYLTLRATGTARLSGPVLHPVLTGQRITVAHSVLYFTDLLTKNVVDLEDPEYAALIDTTALRRRGLGNEFSSRFLDSLRINSLGLHIDNDVWLRSAQANIELEGDLTVDKDRKVYGLTGNLSAPRGTYTLQVGPINRDFSVDQGTVQYYGAPDLDANLNVRAHHQVRTVEGDEFNVVASITGSIRDPRVSLTAPGRDYTERDLASYVLFGQSEYQLTASQQNSSYAGTAVTLALGAFGGAIQQSLVNSGIGVSTFTFRPGVAPGGVVSGSPLTQLAAGWQLGNNWFVTFDAGICLTSSSASFQQRNFGASLEYHVTRQVRLQASAEPVQSCVTNRAADVFTRLNRYQFGGDLLWQRDY
ncbi:MAG: translocation/assembly module TamB domain-containing protein [Gemmatimonadales bacterium]